jgi:hypothetical protein
MKKIILALLLLLAPSLAHANTPVLRCTTAAWDGFVDLKTLPDSNSYILTQLSNGVFVAVWDEYRSADGTQWEFVSAGPNNFSGWSRRSSLNCS